MSATLLIAGKRLPPFAAPSADEDRVEYVLRHPFIQAEAAAFLTRPKLQFLPSCTVREPLSQAPAEAPGAVAGPSDEFTVSRPRPLARLHLFQGEFVLAENTPALRKTVSHIGSSEATTCVIVAMWTPEQTYLVHLDGAQGDRQLLVEFPRSFAALRGKKSMLRPSVASSSPAAATGDDVDADGDVVIIDADGDDDALPIQPIVVHLVGGYVETSGLSRKIVKGILKALAEDPQGRTFDLRTVVVDKLNTTRPPPSLDLSTPFVPRPKCLNLCVSISTGTAFDSSYPRVVESYTASSSPEYLPRRAREGGHALSPLRTLFEIFVVSKSGETVQLVVPNVSWDTPREDLYVQLLRMPDEWLLANCSTSPTVEPPWFVAVMKLGFRFVLKFPSPKAYYGTQASESSSIGTPARACRRFEWCTVGKQRWGWKRV